MTSKKTLRAERDEALRDLAEHRESWQRVSEAARPLFTVLQQRFPDLLAAHLLPRTTGGDVIAALRAAEKALTAAQPRIVRVVMFPRGTSLHKLIGLDSLDTRCGRTATPAMLVGALGDWTDDTPRCDPCFRVRAS